MKDFGALGDNAADDRPAIQQAIDAAGQGGTVYLPPGRYRIASPLRLSLGVTLRGDWNPHFPDRTFMTGSCIRPAYPDPTAGTGFDGDALIVVDPTPVQGSYSTASRSSRASRTSAWTR